MTFIAYFREMNIFFYIQIALELLLKTLIFSSLTTDFDMFETHELLSWYLHGCELDLVGLCNTALSLSSGPQRQVFS